MSNSSTVTNKTTSLPGSIIKGIVDSMNTFITNNANTGLFINCIGVLDNDPNANSTSSFYKSAAYLQNLADNYVIQSLSSLDENGAPITVTNNLNLNPNKYRITVIAPDGLVVFDSNSLLAGNVAASLPGNPVIKENHFNRSCVLRALLYEGEDIKTFTEYKFSNTTGQNYYYAAARIGSLTEPIGVLRIAATVTYK